MKRSGVIEDYNSKFQVWTIRVDNISGEHIFETYNIFKEDIKHDLFLRHPENFDEDMKFSHCIQAKNMATRKLIIGTCKK
jgi:hypothetical protein